MVPQDRIAETVFNSPIVPIPKRSPAELPGCYQEL